MPSHQKVKDIIALSLLHISMRNFFLLYVYIRNRKQKQRPLGRKPNTQANPRRRWCTTQISKSAIGNAYTPITNPLRSPIYPNKSATEMVYDHWAGDTVCSECGLVVESHSIDEFGSNNLVRGGPSNPLLPVGELSTIISKPNIKN